MSVIIKENGTGILFRYDVFNLGMSSRELGKCDVCGKYCNDMFNQQEVRRFHRPDYREIGGNEYGWTYHGTRSIWGHEECLKHERRVGEQIVLIDF